MIKDRCTNVTEVLPSFGNKDLFAEILMMGMYHYAQGMWVVCDASVDYSINRRNEKGGRNENPGVSYSEIRTLCGTDPLPQIRHSVGIFGMYVWYDFTHKYYGVFVHNW